MANEDRRQRPERDARPRPSTRRSRNRTRTALLDAAERLWAERGIQGASLEEVATAAGLTKGAVYSNFTGKADLLLALLERRTCDLPGPADGRAAGDDAFALSGALRLLCTPGRPSTAPDGTAPEGTVDDGPVADWPTHVGGNTADDDTADDAEQSRMLTLLMVELWLYGMRDYSAGWRIADWYHAIRDRLAREFSARDDLPGVSPEERAAMVVAMDLGLTLQHLLDPVRVPPATCAAGMRLVL